MTSDAKCIYNRSITNQEMADKMNIEIKSKDVAKAIADAVEQTAGEHCEAFSTATGSVVALHDTMIAPHHSPV